jgi:hypothetical protein
VPLIKHTSEKARHHRIKVEMASTVSSGFHPTVWGDFFINYAPPMLQACILRSLFTFFTPFIDPYKDKFILFISTIYNIIHGNLVMLRRCT